MNVFLICCTFRFVYLPKGNTMKNGFVTNESLVYAHRNKKHYPARLGPRSCSLEWKMVAASSRSCPGSPVWRLPHSGPAGRTPRRPDHQICLPEMLGSGKSTRALTHTLPQTHDHTLEALHTHIQTHTLEKDTSASLTSKRAVLRVSAMFGKINTTMSVKRKQCESRKCELTFSANRVASSLQPGRHALGIQHLLWSHTEIDEKYDAFKVSH